MKNLITFSLLLVFITISCCKEDPIMPELNVGDSYQGGIVAKIFEPSDPQYIDDGQQHGIICSEVDLENNVGTNTFIWGSTAIQTNATDVMDGQANTTAIVAVETSTWYAAQMCDDYTGGGYTDWYLPSRAELSTLIGSGIVSGTHWSSTELSITQAICVPIPDFGYLQDKDNEYLVRAVRQF